MFKNRALIVLVVVFGLATGNPIVAQDDWYQKGKKYGQRLWDVAKENKGKILQGAAAGIAAGTAIALSVIAADQVVTTVQDRNRSKKMAEIYQLTKEAFKARHPEATVDLDSPAIKALAMHIAYQQRYDAIQALKQKSTGESRQQAIFIGMLYNAFEEHCLLKIQRNIKECVPAS